MTTSLSEFQIPKIASENVDDTKGTFVIEPLDKGFGYTFGNSLRRVLLSSLGGAAIKSVRIEGVAHEFSTVRGSRRTSRTSSSTSRTSSSGCTPMPTRSRPRSWPPAPAR